MGGSPALPMCYLFVFHWSSKSISIGSAVVRAKILNKGVADETGSIGLYVVVSFGMGAG